ncbi:MAG: peptide chain release factor N(5)-glutamine methyltransferase [Bacteroidales bacterium]|nr:peptide chain release factor N(5)-glutamine methyltransferase [Bacteroidales bacterium]MCF8388743.1 peptide chain release factor N(5)-glutamine methyltransferase [Bacteroidales bacterium]MCF8396904.1 peptide chain release factor N(5)-glutamine methyltransferase [Bacteroidales bacterium]
MDFASNRFRDVFRYYQEELQNTYDQTEARNILFLLFESILKTRKADLIINSEQRISESEILEIHKAVLKLKQNWPIQYITGETEFLNCRIMLNRNVLIPRPETEELVKFVSENLKSCNSQLKILDIGTGSGCIAIALKTNIIHANVFAIDNSSKAIETAIENAAINKTPVDFAQADILNYRKPLGFPDKFDVLISNPPYVRLQERNEMKPNVLDYEPEEALFVKDEDPLLYYRNILDVSSKILTENGKIYLEINEYMHNDLKDLLNRYPQYTYYFQKDLRDKYRMLSLYR